MAISIEVPSVAYAASTVTLGGNVYTFIFQFNDRENRWYVDIMFGINYVVRGIKLVEYAGLINKYDLPDFNHGRLFVEAQRSTNREAGFDNIGIDKDYLFFYMSNEELGI